MKPSGGSTGAGAATTIFIAALAITGPTTAQVDWFETPLSQATADDVAEGRRVYNAQCALCHGIEGVGGAGPALQQPTLRRVADDEGLVLLLRKGVPGAMPGAEGSNAPRRVWQAAAYVRSLGRVASETPPGNPERGADLYRRRACGTCHVVKGEGRALGPDLSAVGDQRGLAYLREALVEPEAKVPDGHVTVTVRPRRGKAVRGVRVDEDVFGIHVRDTSGALHHFRKAELDVLEREVGASLMPAYGGLLSPAEIDDLVAYLAGLRGER
jgi:putative heme-binding domain-containing protein